MRFPTWLAFTASAAILCASAPVRSQTVFRSGVQYVAVDVVVTDRNDVPVTDLTKDDFEVFERGRAQKISDFQFVSVPLGNRIVDPLVIAQSPEPEPDVATNAAPKPASRLFVIVIDDLHLIESDLVPVKRLMTDFLKVLTPDDEVAVVYANRSDLSINFTSNTTRVLHAIDNMRAALGFGLDALAAVVNPNAEPSTGMPGLGERRGYGEQRPSRQRLSYALMTNEVLRNIAASLEGSSHARRSIVLVSGGSTLDPFGDLQLSDPFISTDQKAYRDDLLRTFDALKRADVPVYSLDPRGVALPETSVRDITKLSNPTVWAQAARNIRAQQDTLSAVSINTGGRAILNAADMKRMVQGIVQENGSFYLLGYYPEPLISDGKFHEFDVRVKRPGLIVRARKGYTATSDKKTKVSSSTLLSDAMQSGVNVSGLSLRVFAAPLAFAPKGVTTGVVVQVSYTMPANAPNKFSDNVTLNITALDADAKVKARTSRSMKFSGTAPPSGTVTFLMDDLIELPPQPLTLRVGVVSELIGKAGTSQIAVDVPNPNDDRLQMGNVVFGFPGPPRQAAMNAPLVVQLVPFQPTTSRAFRKTNTLRIFTRLFWKGAGEPTTTMTLVGAGPSRSITTTADVNEFDSGKKQADVNAVLPLADLAAGAYRLTVRSVLPNGQSAERVILFEVTEPAPRTSTGESRQ